MSSESEIDSGKPKAGKRTRHKRRRGTAEFAPITKKPIKGSNDNQTALLQEAPGQEGRLEPPAPTEEKHRSKPTPEGRPKNRGVVYHDAERYSGYQRHGRRSSGSTDDYHRGSTSDEYKRRIYDSREREREVRRGDNEDSGYTYKITAAALALFIIILATVIFIIASQETLYNEFDVKYTMNLETWRVSAGFMSENIDCSIHMKRRFIQGDPPQEVIRQGLMCLYALAPHTVHENSSVQMTFLHRRTKAGFSKDAEKLGSRGNLTCELGKDRVCRFREVPFFLHGMGYLNMTLRESPLSKVWLEHYDIHTEKHEEIWSRREWMRKKLNGTRLKVRPRKFRVPYLLVRLSKTSSDVQRRMKSWQKRFAPIDIGNLSTRDTITITPEEAKRAVEIFATSTGSDEDVADQLMFYRLTYDKVTHRGLTLVIPKRRHSKTLSFLTAFIIKVVYEAFMKAQPNLAELSLQVMSVNAQMIAMQLIRGTREWTGKTEGHSLMNMWKDAVDQIIKQTYNPSRQDVFRNGTDRVSPLMVWSRTRLGELFTLMELGLPQTFDPNDDSGKRVNCAPFVHISGDKSVEYCSAAGIVIVESRPGYSTPVMAAAASGTERTVEGVANAILRVLLLKNQAGEAVNPEKAFLNPADGMVYCEELLNAFFMDQFDFKCHRKQVIKPDRSVMIAERFLSSRNMTFAMTQTYGEYNYAVGY
ncbi:hypothetical protein V3C99_003923 [Haemonchus contortus]